MLDEQDDGSSGTASDEARWLDAIATLIQDAGEPVAFEQVLSWVDDLGAVFKSESDLQRKLTRRFSQIKFSRVSSSFTWSEEPSEKPTTDAPPPLLDLIKSWNAATQAERQSLDTQITARSADQTSDPSAVQLARALGVITGEIDWSELSPDTCVTADVLTVVAGSAPPWWTFDACVTLATKPAGAIRKHLQAQPEIDRLEIAASSLDRWYSEPVVPDAAARVRRIRTAVGVPPNQLLLRAALGHALGFADDRNRDADLLALTSLVLESESDELDSALDHISDTAGVKTWLTVLATMKCPESDRSRLIAAVARTKHRTALFDKSVFMGLSLDALGGLLAGDPFPALLDRGLDAHVRDAVDTATPTKLGLALAPVASHPHLAPLMPIGLLTKLMKGKEASATIARESAHELIEQALSDQHDRHQLEIEQIRTELDAADSARRHTEEVTTAERRRADDAEERLRRAIKDSTTASSGELRQAQLDVIRSMVDHAVRLGDARSVADNPEPFLALETSLEKQLLEFDVRAVGQRGASVEYDPALHEPVDVEPGTEVELVRPAFLIGDTLTPLRYGLVRQITER